MQFFTQALGGPKIYQGPSMADAHKNLHITARNFDRVAVHLKETLESLGVESGHIDTIMNTVAPLKGDIVNENATDTTNGSSQPTHSDSALRDVDTSKSVTDSLEGVKSTMASLQANVFVADTNLNIVYINPVPQKHCRLLHNRFSKPSGSKSRTSSTAISTAFTATRNEWKPSSAIPRPCLTPPTSTSVA